MRAPRLRRLQPASGPLELRGRLLRGAGEVLGLTHDEISKPVARCECGAAKGEPCRGRKVPCVKRTGRAELFHGWWNRVPDIGTLNLKREWHRAAGARERRSSRGRGGWQGPLHGRETRFRLCGMGWGSVDARSAFLGRRVDLLHDLFDSLLELQFVAGGEHDHRRSIRVVCLWSNHHNSSRIEVDRLIVDVGHRDVLPHDHRSLIGVGDRGTTSPIHYARNKSDRRRRADAAGRAGWESGRIA